MDGQLDIFRIKVSQTAYGRALEAKTNIANYVAQKINQSRLKINNNCILNYVLQHNSTEYISRELSEQELIIQIVQILFAGYESTASFIFWTIFSIYKHPNILDSLKQEDNDTSTILNYCLFETERLFPPVYAIPRGLSQDFYFNGYHIPKTWNIFLSPLITHRMEETFTNPNSFHPQRFEESSLRKKLFGFGAGQHQCLGKEIAKLEARLFISLLLKHQFTIKPDTPFNAAIQNSDTLLKRLFISLS